MEQLPKVAISTEADACLEQVRRSVNNGFTSGKVNKGQLASWIIMNFSASLTPKFIDKIRSDHFDEIAHLEAVVKQLKEARESNASVAVHDLLTPVLQRQRTSSATSKKDLKNSSSDESF